MSITRFNEFRAQPDKVAELREFLSTVAAGIALLPGCQSSQLLQSHADPARFVVLEVWDSIEAHQASARNIAPESIAQLMKLIDGRPQGEYFHERG